MGLFFRTRQCTRVHRLGVPKRAKFGEKKSVFLVIVTQVLIQDPAPTGGGGGRILDTIFAKAAGGPGAALGPLVGSRGKALVGVEGRKPRKIRYFRRFLTYFDAFWCIEIGGPKVLYDFALFSWKSFA